MNGFKFTDFKCLAMMFLIIMAFCGDAGQYLLMAATLIWLIAKVLELHRSRKKEPPVQKGKAPAKPASSPAVQPAPASRPAAAPQPPKPAAAKPQAIDPEMEAVMLRHINFRITEKLQGAFPSAVWRWETAKPLEQAMKGGSARIRLSGVPDWNFADVRFERSGRIKLEMLSLRPLEEVGQQEAKSTPAADGDAVNLRDRYDLSASAVVRATIDEVYTRGYRELYIAEDGALYVLEQQEQVKHGLPRYGELYRLQPHRRQLPGPTFSADDLRKRPGDREYPSSAPGADQIGTWAFDLLSYTNRKPDENYREARPCFKEKQSTVLGSLVGKTVVVTGTVPNYTRSEVEFMIQKAGGKMGSSVTRSTDYLVVAEKPGATKLNRAADLGIPQITVSDLMAMLD